MLLSFTILTGISSSRINLLAIFLITPCISEKLEAGLLVQRTYKIDKPPKNSGDEFFISSLDDSDLLVDKSLFIKDLIEDGGKFYLITSPRCWGKSLNLDMLKTFIQYDVHDYEGEIKYPTSVTINHRLFVKGEIVADPSRDAKGLKSPTLIAKHKNIIKQHMSNYPVIHTYLFANGNVTPSSYYSSLQTHIQVAFDDHKYIMPKYRRALIDSPQHYTEEEKEEARAIYPKFGRFWFGEDPMNITELLEAYTFLSEVLYLHYKKKVWLLMDAYHSPFEELFLYNELTPEEQKKFFDFFVQFIKSSFVDNPYLEKGIVVGLYPPTEELFQGAFANFTMCNPMTGKFMEHFNFNQYDMQALYQFLKTPKTTQQEIDHWYKGYKINNRDFDSYNSRAIAMYLQKRRVDTFWVRTTGIRNFMRSFLKLDSFKEKFLSLLNGNDIVVRLDRERFTWDEYDILIGAEWTEITPTDDFVDKAFMHLYNLGYLTLSENYNLSSKTYTYRMRVPNNEIRADMKDKYETMWIGPTATYYTVRHISSEEENR